jgi:UDP-glucuronate decarboxylase
MMQNRNMHLLVTGGTGFFGKALLRYWSAGNVPNLTKARFTLLSRNPEQFISANAHLISGLNVQLVQGDIQRPKTLPEGDYTHVLHAATDSTAGLQLTPLDRFNQIVEGTRNVLELARRCKTLRLLMTSSGGVYGNISHFTDGVPEDYLGMPDPLVPDNAYSVAKRQAEHLCALYNDAYGIQCVIARCFAFVGEDLPLNAHFAIGNFIRDALAGKEILIKGNGKQVRSYMDQRDLARWITVLLFKGKNNRAYNVGSPAGLSIFEIARKIAHLYSNKKPEIRVLNEEITVNDINRNFYVPNVSRAKLELNLELQFDFDESIRNTIYTIQNSKLTY